MTNRANKDATKCIRAWEIHKDADQQLHSRLGFFTASQSFLLAAYVSSVSKSDSWKDYLALNSVFIAVLGLSYSVIFFIGCRKLIKGIEYLKDKYLCREDDVYAEYLVAARGGI